MATTFEEQQRRRLGAPIGIPAPLPILTASMAAPTNPPPIAAPVAAPAVAPGEGPQTFGQIVRNAFGGRTRVSPQLGLDTTPNAAEALSGNPALMVANNPATPAAAGGAVPSVVPSVAPAARLGQPVVAAAAPPPPVPGAVAPAVAGLPGAEGTQPVNASEGALSPVAATNLGRPNELGSLADTNAQLATLQASNAQLAAARPAPGGPSIIGPVDYANRNAGFNDGAALRTAAAQGSWSPRRGYQGNDDAVRAAAIPVANAARMGEAQLNADTQQATTAAREAGDTARLGMRTAADTAQAAITGGRDQQRLDMEKQTNSLRATGLGLDNATKQRVEIVQQEVASAKTPEARRAASEKLAALTGRATQDQFAALELGGGSTVDPTTGVAVPQPKSAILYNKATGKYEQVGGAAAAPAAKTPAEGSMSTSNGKPIRFTNGKWVAA